MKENTTEPATHEMVPNILQRYPKLGPIVGICAAFLILAGAVAARQYIRYQDSSASCYGYGCEPSVRLGARIPSYGYGAPLQYGYITIYPGQPIEVSWYGQNVDDCSADGRWTNFRGTYYPPTIFSPPINQTRTLSVTCYRNRRAVASSTLNVLVQQAPTYSLTVAKNQYFGDQEYVANGKQFQVGQYVMTAGVVKRSIAIHQLTFALHTSMTPKQIGPVYLSFAVGPQILGTATQSNGLIYYSFNVESSIPSSATANVVLYAAPQSGIAGSMQFEMTGVYTDTGVNVTGLPSYGQMINFSVFNCIKAPCEPSPNLKIRQ